MSATKEACAVCGKLVVHHNGKPPNVHRFSRRHLAAARTLRNKAAAERVALETLPKVAWCLHAPCFKGFREHELKDGVVPTHDFPPPCRSVCPGSGKAPSREAPHTTTPLPPPIPLSAPDGKVYAYACGACRHVHAGSHMLSAHDDDTVTEFAEQSKDEATRCCRCTRCKRALLTEKGLFFPKVCEGCQPAQEAEDAARDASRQALEEKRNAILAEHLKAAKDPDAVAMLESQMSNISEDAYCAGWLLGLEFYLWDMVLGGDRAFGVGEVSEGEVDELRKLSETCGGWLKTLEQDDFYVGQVFVPIETWNPIFEAWKKNTDKKRAEREAMGDT